MPPVALILLPVAYLAGKVAHEYAERVHGGSAVAFMGMSLIVFDVTLLAMIATCELLDLDWLWLVWLPTI